MIAIAIHYGASTLPSEKLRRRYPLAELVVIGFNDKHSAETVRTKLLQMQREYLVDLEDAVVAVKKDDGKIKLHQIHHLTAQGAIGGTFWGTLIGLIFMSPFLGAAVGAAAGAIGGALADVGIDDAFMKKISETLSAGTSALFILIRKATLEKVLEELRPYEGRVIQTSLSYKDEDALRDVLEKARSSIQSS
jgi:uncharacterized membrane protein